MTFKQYQKSDLTESNNEIYILLTAELTHQTFCCLAIAKSRARK